MLKLRLQGSFFQTASPALRVAGSEDVGFPLHKANDLQELQIHLHSVEYLMG